MQGTNMKINNKILPELFMQNKMYETLMSWYYSFCALIIQSVIYQQMQVTDLHSLC